jgi:type II secretory pathway component GspD/PulD (secretin)
VARAHRSSRQLGASAFWAPTSSPRAKNIINIGQAAAIADPASITPGQGMNIAAARKFNGVYVLGFLANFLQTNADGNILSTPNLVTLDNEEAKIIIGKNVPFPTGSYTNTGGSSSAVNPFTTVERKDVGLTLRVKPQISEKRHHQDGDLPGGQQHRAGVGAVQGRFDHQQARHRNQRAGRGRGHHRARAA